MKEDEIRSICKELVEDDPSLTLLQVRLDDGDEVNERIISALKQNSTIDHLDINDGVLSFHFELLVAQAISVHPKLKTVEFNNVETDDLSVIARAMAHMARRPELTLWDDIRLESLDGLCYLLKYDIVGSLRIDSLTVVEDEDDAFRMLGKSLRENKSLTNFALYWCPEGDNGNLLRRSISSMVKWNQRLSYLTLHFENEMAMTMDDVSRLAGAATGHRRLKSLSLRIGTELNEIASRRISTMLQETPRLRDFSLTDFSAQGRAASILADGLRNHQRGLRELDLSNARSSSLNPRNLGWKHLCRSLIESNWELSRLDLDHRSIGDDGARYLAKDLEHNDSLELLFLVGNEIGYEGATAISEALISNTSIRWLYLDDNPFTAKGYSKMGEMLTRNTSLERIKFGNLCKEDLIALFQYVPSMNLRNLDLCGFVIESASDKLECEEAFIRALERNTKLKGVIYEMTPINRTRVDYLLLLNRHDRRVLTLDPEVPRHYWQRILSNISHCPDALFFFCREKPDVLFM